MLPLLLDCCPSAIFSSRIVSNMSRVFRRLVQSTSRFPAAHGVPPETGEPSPWQRGAQGVAFVASARKFLLAQMHWLN